MSPYNNSNTKFSNACLASYLCVISKCVPLSDGELKGTNMKYHSVPAFYDTSMKFVNLFKIILWVGVTLTRTDIMRPQVYILWKNRYARTDRRGSLFRIMIRTRALPVQLWVRNPAVPCHRWPLSRRSFSSLKRVLTISFNTFNFIINL